MPDCIFCKIVKREIPVKPVSETDDYIAFNDIESKAPTHFLVIPKTHITSLNEAEDTALLGKLMEGAKTTATKLGIKDGYRVVINTGEEAGQSVFHLHLHVLGGRPMLWPPG